MHGGAGLTTEFWHNGPPEPQPGRPLQYFHLVRKTMDTVPGGYDRQTNHSHGGVYLLVVITGHLTVQGQISPVLWARQFLQKIALFANAHHHHYH